VKKLLTNLLMVVALALCVLCAVQWVREVHLRQQVHDLLNSRHDGRQALADLKDQLTRSEAEVQRLEKLRVEMLAKADTNAFVTLDLRKQLDQAKADAQAQGRSAEKYKSALEKANRNIARQNQSIHQQNDELKKLAQERNEIVAKYNKLAKDFDGLAKKWNDQQQELARKTSRQQ
jgi:chromosome segregation ATPase